MSLSTTSKFPFNRLPTEIKSKIFILDTHIKHWACLSHLYFRAIVLGSICQEWHDLAWSLPQLWSTILVDSFDDNSETFDLYLKNSKNRPLDVGIFFDVDEDHLAEAAHILDKLRREGHRLKSLYVFFDERADNRTITRSFNQLIQCNMPILEKVESEWDDTSRPFIINVNMFENSPRLRDLSLLSIVMEPNKMPSFKQVTKLTVRSTLIEICTSALVYLPNLTELECIKMEFSPFSDSEWPPTFQYCNGSSITVHNSLKSLKIDVDEYSDTDEVESLFLQSISCPSLNTLIITNSWSADYNVILHAATRFFQVSNCPIETLKLNINRLTSGVWPLLDCVHTTIETLRLQAYDSSYKEDAVIQSLLKKLSSASYLPHVKRVYINQSTGSLDYANIYRQLKARMDTWPYGVDTRPSLFRIILSTETSIPAVEIDDEVVNGFRDLKEKGMEVSLKARNFTPNAILQQYKYDEDE